MNIVTIKGTASLIKSADSSVHQSTGIRFCAVVVVVVAFASAEGDSVEITTRTDHLIKHRSGVTTCASRADRGLPFPTLQRTLCLSPDVGLELQQLHRGRLLVKRLLTNWLSTLLCKATG